jgi:hypothetical protein
MIAATTSSNVRIGSRSSTRFGSGVSTEWERTDRVGRPRGVRAAGLRRRGRSPIIGAGKDADVTQDDRTAAAGS